MEFIEAKAVRSLVNPGVESRQLINPDHSGRERVTLTQVHVAPGAQQPRHTHETSEQIWYALSGRGTLLLDGGAERTFEPGNVVRFADGDVHGLRNDGDTQFVYLCVTSPPIHFGYAYAETR